MDNRWTLFKDLKKKEQDLIIVDIIDKFYDDHIHFDSLDPRVPTSNSIRKRLINQKSTFYFLLNNRILKTRNKNEQIPDK